MIIRHPRRYHTQLAGDPVMKRVVLVLAFCLSLVGAALAQGGMMPGPGTPASSGGGGYQGPGDIATGWNPWYGLRAYNAAYATGSNNAIQIKPLAGTNSGSTKNIVILSSGALDITTANSWSGTDITCTAGSATASTTLTVSGCSAGTPLAIDSITATVSSGSFPQPAFVTATPASFSGGAGSVTLLAPITAVLTNVVFQAATRATIAYDQSGNGINATVVTSNGPYLLPDCGNALPCLYNVSSSTALTGTVSAYSAPYTMSAVAERTTLIGPTESYIATIYNGGGGVLSFDEGGVAGKSRLYCGFDLNVTGVSDGTLHALNGVCNSSGQTSILSVDGNNSGTSTSASGAGSTSYSITNDNSFATPLNGFWMESGVNPADQTSHFTALCHNQRLYWRSTGSC